MEGVTELKLGVDGVLERASDGARCALTRSEAGVFLAIARRNGAPIRKESLMQELYQGQDEPELKIVDVFVCKLRKKLQEAFGLGACVKTNWGFGYSFDVAMARLHLPDADHVTVEVDKPTLRRLEELALALDTDVGGVVERVLQDSLKDLEAATWK